MLFSEPTSNTAWGKRSSRIGSTAPLRRRAQDWVHRNSSEAWIEGRPRAERALALLRKHYGSSVSYQFAVIHAQLGDKDRAFAELDNALAVKDPGLVGLKTDAFLDPIRDDARYRQLLGKLNFP